MLQIAAVFSTWNLKERLQNCLIFDLHETLLIGIEGKD